jgi:hypothetical protein
MATPQTMDTKGNTKIMKNNIISNDIVSSHKLNGFCGHIYLKTQIGHLKVIKRYMSLKLLKMLL